MRGSVGTVHLRTLGAQVQIAWLLFVLATIISVILIWAAGTGQAFKGDEWVFAYRLSNNPLLDAILHAPPGKYLIVLPMLFYKAAFSTIGIDDYLPYRLVGMALTVAAAALFLHLAARRVGHVIALPGAVLILFLGSSSEVTATPLRIPAQVALVAGLGVLVLLERRDLRADVAACLLLLVSITSHPLGTAFAAAAAVLVLSRPAPERWQRVWVFVVPLLVFALWYLTLREPYSGTPSLVDQLRDLPRFEFQSLAVMAASATGAFHWPTATRTDFLSPLTYLLAGAIIVLTAAAVARRRTRPEFWAILAALIVLFGAPVFAAGGARSPTATRYILPGVVMLLLLLSELGREVRFIAPQPRAVAGVGTAVILLFAIVSNAEVLEQRARAWAVAGSQERAELTALDLARAHDRLVSVPAGQVVPGQIPQGALAVPGWYYFAVRPEYGSPAFTPAQLRAQPASVRAIADAVLARALGLHLAPVSRMPQLGHSSPRVLGTTGDVEASRSGCVTLLPRGASASSQIAVPPGGVVLTGARRANELALARFGATYALPLEYPQSSRIGVLRIPHDTSETSWKLLIAGARRPVDVCAITSRLSEAQR